MPGDVKELIGHDAPDKTIAREHPNTPKEKFCISEMLRKNTKLRCDGRLETQRVRRLKKNNNKEREKCAAGPWRLPIIDSAVSCVVWSSSSAYFSV